MYPLGKVILRHTMLLAFVGIYLFMSVVIVTAQQKALPKNDKNNSANLIVNGKPVVFQSPQPKQNPVGKILISPADSGPEPTPARIAQSPAEPTSPPQKTNTTNSTQDVDDRSHLTNPIPSAPSPTETRSLSLLKTGANVPPVAQIKSIAAPLSAPQRELNLTPPTPVQIPKPQSQLNKVSSDLIDRMTSDDRVKSSLSQSSQIPLDKPSLKISELPLVNLDNSKFNNHSHSQRANQTFSTADRAVYYPSTENQFPIVKTSGVGNEDVANDPASGPFRNRAQTNMLKPMVQPSIFSQQKQTEDKLPPGHIRNPFIEPTAGVNQRQRILSQGEYLKDGGDRNLKVSVGDDWQVQGLDTEDTIGHFDTLDGERVVVPSNRVDVYAPRFASVGKTGNMTSANSFEKIAKVDDTRMSFQSGTYDIAASSKQNVAPVRSLGSKSVSALRDQTRGLVVDNTTQTGQTISNIGPERIHQFMVSGVLKDTEKAFLAASIQSAITWTEDLEVKVVNKDAIVIVVDDVDSLQEVHESHSPNTDARLRIVKLANKRGAQPGDDLEFIIRFDNVGNQLIGNVTVIDNLTTRLGYIEGSASCTVKADLITSENDGQSTKLRWEVLEPLKPGQGGVIRFRCRVR